jgi:hypothetical protein
MRLQYIIPGKAQDVFAIEQSIYEYFGIVSSHDYIASFPLRQDSQNTFNIL